jgi:anti-sigma factor RsiW
MADALSLLRAYSSGKLGPDDAEVVEALLTDYLDGTLDSAFEAEVTAVIVSDPALAADVESARRGGAWIDNVLIPLLREEMDRPLSPKMRKFIDDLLYGP